ncbi:hypothetical protein [Streptomyces sp. 030-HV]|uniref:hypothetical protein n=1 Tax=Streptomyces sp. 030-HV TaxID=2789262 RepID=UPI00397F7327
MKIRMLVSMPEGAVLHGRPWPTEGTEIDDLPTTVAAHLVASGVAEEITEAPPARRRRTRKGGDGG